MEDGKFSKNLQLAREKANLTQLEVATKVGIHVNYYARIERGYIPAMKTLKAIAKVLKVKVSDVLPF